MKSYHQAWSLATEHWQKHIVGGGNLEIAGPVLRLAISDTSAKQYSNAQIDDYQGLPRHEFLWRPPIRLIVRARFSHPTAALQGTAGFGFWNDPFLMTGARLPTLPRAVWFFFASPPSNMKLAMDVPGRGWKAATIDALHPKALLWAPLAPLAVPLMNTSPIYTALWPSIQQALKIREAAIPIDMTQWYTYVLDWKQAGSTFGLISQGSTTVSPILKAPSPGGPLGFVMWMDNQYMVVTPGGRLRWGLLEVPGRQWMEVDRLDIEPIEDNR